MELAGMRLRLGAAALLTMAGLPWWRPTWCRRTTRGLRATAAGSASRPAPSVTVALAMAASPSTAHRAPRSRSPTAVAIGPSRAGRATSSSLASLLACTEQIRATSRSTSRSAGTGWTPPRRRRSPSPRPRRRCSSVSTLVIPGSMSGSSPGNNPIKPLSVRSGSRGRRHIGGVHRPARPLHRHRLRHRPARADGRGLPVAGSPQEVPRGIATCSDMYGAGSSM